MISVAGSWHERRSDSPRKIRHTSITDKINTFEDGCESSPGLSREKKSAVSNVARRSFDFFANDTFRKINRYFISYVGEARKDSTFVWKIFTRVGFRKKEEKKEVNFLYVEIF